MRIVIDTNRLLAAALKNGSTRRQLIQTQSEVFAPTLLAEELTRHLPGRAKRLGLRIAALDELIGLLTADVRWVDRATLDPFLPQAEAALGSFDANDVPFLATALAIEADAIWSEDRDFDRQTLVPRTRHPDRIER